MNEFTKDELEILFALVSLVRTPKTYKIHDYSKFDILIKKLELMHDNYCSHNGERVSDSCMVEVCKDCGRFV